jgi:hypothetical protein
VYEIVKESESYVFIQPVFKIRSARGCIRKQQMESRFGTSMTQDTNVAVFRHDCHGNTLLLNPLLASKLHQRKTKKRTEKNAITLFCLFRFTGGFPNFDSF